jgi:hypothetical protein
MGYDTLPDRSARYAFAPPGVVRMTCECCGFPTLALTPETDWASVDWESSALACPLCNWESGPAMEDGSPDPAARSPEDRNEGYALAEAQENFRRHGWMYDPAAPPLWMGGPPAAEELELRRALREAYEALGAAPERRERGDPWERVLDLEFQLRAAEEARRAALEDRLDEQAEWEDEDDPTAA